MVFTVMGYCQAIVTINNNDFHLSTSLQMDAIIGNKILSQGKVLINSERIKITKLNHSIQMIYIQVIYL